MKPHRFRCRACCDGDRSGGAVWFAHHRKGGVGSGEGGDAGPGSPLDPRAEGCNELIKHGAALIRNADNVEEALGGPRHLSLQEPEALFEHNIEVKYDPDLAVHAASLLGGAPIDADILARDLGVPPAALAVALVELDLAGKIERRPGGLIALAPE